MPTEIRHIVFSQEELVDALIRYFRFHPTLLPVGEIVACKIEKDPEFGKISCAVVMRADSSDEEEERKLESNLVAAAMLGYCIAKKIPIAKKYCKSLQIMDNNLALSLRLESPNVSTKLYVD